MPHAAAVKYDERASVRQYLDLACTTRTSYERRARAVRVGQRFERQRATIAVAPLWIGVEETAIRNGGVTVDCRYGGAIVA